MDDYVYGESNDCVNQDQVCDGIVQCPSERDEFNCTYQTSEILFTLINCLFNYYSVTELFSVLRRGINLINLIALFKQMNIFLSTANKI